ncbi:hypothetical protein CEXT_569651 [Caerostris extrusa]|uniref:Uncharacterized protein n=1 Tax=Caerostris extrusa TaxID=172846 RepID=A0AAV4XSY3_CAEEX|nr:hypothetical protein CEXT_569651 [Caerostris extrusa]
MQTGCSFHLLFKYFRDSVSERAIAYRYANAKSRVFTPLPFNNRGCLFQFDLDCSVEDQGGCMADDSLAVIAAIKTISILLCNRFTRNFRRKPYNLRCISEDSEFLSGELCVSCSCTRNPSSPPKYAFPPPISGSCRPHLSPRRKGCRP